MPSTSHRALRHMAWANQKVYASMQSLPGEALSAYIVNPDWTAGIILHHIAKGSDWLSYCLTSTQRTDVEIPTSMAQVADIAKLLETLDGRIFSQADLPDEPVTINRAARSWQALRSTILAQAVNHATEHRAQLIDALECKGYQPINLDSIDLWAFAEFEKTKVN